MAIMVHHDILDDQVTLPRKINPPFTKIRNAKYILFVQDVFDTAGYGRFRLFTKNFVILDKNRLLTLDVFSFLFLSLLYFLLYNIV